MALLDGRVAIVTGTSRGVGVGIAKRLLEEGASVVGCSRRELPALPAAEGNVSSGASHPAGSPSLVSYGAAKAGLNHMTRSLAQEWGPKIRVNCLVLGPTLTDNFRRLVLGQDDPDGRRYFANVPLQRAGEPEEVGSAVVFLCSGAADIINGATIEMDGGMLPGVLYEPGLAPIRAMLAAAQQGEKRHGS